MRWQLFLPMCKLIFKQKSSLMKGLKMEKLEGGGEKLNHLLVAMRKSICEKTERNKDSEIYYDGDIYDNDDRIEKMKSHGEFG